MYNHLRNPSSHKCSLSEYVSALATHMSVEKLDTKPVTS